MAPKSVSALAALLVCTCGHVRAEWKAHFKVAGLAGGGTGEFTVVVHPEWAPLGAQRFAELVKEDFFVQTRFFRVLKDFMAQFGVSGEPAVAKTWRERKLKDDPNKASNTRGRVTYAMAGPNTRTTQLFINFKDNSFLDGQGFSPFAEVTEGMDVVDKLYNGYGEGSPGGRGPDQGRIQGEGNKYLEKDFPLLSYISEVTMEGDADAPPGLQAKFAEGAEGIKEVPKAGLNVVALFVLGMLCVGFAVVAVARTSFKGSSSSRDDQTPKDVEDVEGQELTEKSQSPHGGRKRPQAAVE